jgi:putative hydrolase of the HAD superfamily
MPSANELDGVTVDAFGTLLTFEDPAVRLQAALSERDLERPLDDVRAAFKAEASYYRTRSLRGRDAESLAALRRECVGVFLDKAGVPLDPVDFVEAFIDAIVFHLIDGAEEALDTLRSAGLSLACVANWDASLFAHLRRLGVDDRFEVVLTSAEAGSEKPDARIFLAALEQLDIEPARALHVGDDEIDCVGARAAGLRFEPVPLATLPRRLGL